MKIFGLAASTRENSYNRLFLSLALRQAAAAGVDTSSYEYGEFDAPAYSDGLLQRSGLPPGAQRFSDVVHASNAMIIACPEYNWSFPGSLKNLIDWASAAAPQPFKGKTALLLSATPSPRGGLSGLMQLRVPLEALGVFIAPRMYGLGNAPAAFEQDELKEDSARRQLADTVEEFLAFTKKMMA